MTSKKLKYSTLIIFIFLVFAEISVALSNDLFFEKVALKEVEKRSMPRKTANAVKHAYAASLLYWAFRKVYFSEEMAKNSVIFLGKINEIAELIFKSKTDSTLEMMKDLENNLIGIYAAKWIEENSSDASKLNRISIIGDLAQREILILAPESILLPEEEKISASKFHNFSAAQKWFEENKSEIEKKISELL